MNRELRAEKIIGKNNINRLKNTSILLVGLGGVGGSCLEMLARAGIGNITIVDYDIFEESNLNRQLLSLEDNIGECKTLVAKKRVESINSDIIVKEINNKLDDETINEIPKTDYIIDACDDINAKVLLIKYAIKNNIKIISSCGTGNRLDPTKLKISNIWKTEYDPLAKKLRQYLRKEGIKYKVPVVFSEEQPVIKSSGYVGSMAMVPNCAGIILASYVINDVLKGI